MRYKLRFQKPSTNVPFSASGSYVAASGWGVSSPVRSLVAWLPSTWPAAPATVDDRFVEVLKTIFEESILGEIHNVVSDAQRTSGGLEHRGHVVAIALFCALDAISSCGYGRKSGRQIAQFVPQHFPVNYQPFGEVLRDSYRHALVHGWNLFDVAIYPGKEKPSKSGGVFAFGLLDFFDALVDARQDLLERLGTDPELQRMTLERYSILLKDAKA